MLNTQNLKKAFTLIEMLITLAILGILLGVAYPAYQQQVLRANRIEGKTALLELASTMERFYTENNAYNATGSPALSGAYDSESGKYRINLSTASPAPAVAANTYLLTATGQGAQANDTACLTLSIDHLSQKLPSGCW